MAAPSFATLDPAEFEYGRVDQVSPSIRRVIAENPSKFTYHGTGTYIVGRGDVVVIDPGPVLDSHRDALAAALRGERVRAILVTHCHADHSPLAAWLAAETGAPTVAFGPHPPAGPDDEIDDRPPEEKPKPKEPDAAGETGERGEGEAGGPAEIKPAEIKPAEIKPAEIKPAEIKMEEAVDRAFTPDIRVVSGDLAAEGPGFTFTAVHTPGHTSNHTCFAFAEERALFTGDHVMGWSTTVVAPPDGDMAAYIASLEAVARRDDEVFWPTHGPPRHDGPAYVSALVEHRLQRERQILDAVAGGRQRIMAMVELLYADVRSELHEAAARSVLSHLVKLVDEGRVEMVGADRPRLGTTYVLAEARG